jgi:NAD-dependent deacetylase
MAKLIIFSGAGLSAESGLATFRGSPDGLWENYKIDVVCNYLTWKQNYDLVHGFYNARRAQLATVEPNAAHRLIADWQQRYDTVVVTQNVDDLLERAGCTDVIHLHGHLTEMTCEACGHVWDVGYEAWGAEHRCPNVGKKGPCASRKGVKPNVVLFNQRAPRYREMYMIINLLHENDVVLVSGTSEQVIPFGTFLRGRPGFKIFNAMEPSLNGAYDESLIMPASEAFPLVDKIVKLLL